MIIGVLLLILLLILMLAWSLLRNGPATSPTVTGSTSASPTGSATATAAVDPSLEPPTPEAPPSQAGGVAPTPSGATAGPPGDSDLAAFDPDNTDRYSGSAVSMFIDGSGIDFDDWRSERSTIADMLFTEEGFAGRGTVQLALLSASERRTFATCRDKTSWVPAVTWDEVARGTFVCIKWEARRGLMRVDQMPDMDKSNPKVAVTGIIWRPEVKQ